MQNFSCLGWLKLLNYTFPGGRPADRLASRPNLKLMLTSAQLGQLGLGLSLATRIRLDRSDLNLHRYTIGSSDSPECACHAKQESSYHYIIDCFLYDCERQILFDSVEYYIPDFRKLGKRKKFEIITIGINIQNPDFYYTNYNISIAVQKYIFKTKRFPT